MKRFERAERPPHFEEVVGAPGRRWLKAHPGSGRRPPDYWRKVNGELREAFGSLCAYLAMLDLNGTVDHYRSWKNDPQAAYEWENYRYATGWLNSTKQTLDAEVLDPFEVEDDWFRVLIPSFQLELTEAIPDELRSRAEITIDRLGLQRGPKARKAREKWFREYCSGRIRLDGLEMYAPLVAQAVRRLDPEDLERYRRHMNSTTADAPAKRDGVSPNAVADR